MRVAALCSGGKDSAYSLWLALKQGHKVVRVVAMLPEREDSWMFHYPNIRLIDLFAECAGLPLLKAETSGVKEEELHDLECALRGLDVEGVVSGAISSNYQKNRIDSICKGLGLASIAPLWERAPAELMHEIVNSGFKAIVTSVAAQGFDESWLGREIDGSALRDLTELGRKYRVNPSGEGGEYESLVLDAPFFSKRIKPIKTKRVWRGTNGYLLVERAEIVEKR